MIKWERKYVLVYERQLLLLYVTGKNQGADRKDSSNE